MAENSEDRRATPATRAAKQAAEDAHIKERGDGHGTHSIPNQPASERGSHDERCETCGMSWGMHLRDWNGTAHCLTAPCRCRTDLLEDAQEPDPAAVAAELTAVAFTPGLADAICRHGKPIGGCVDCAKERARVSKGARAAQIDPDRASRLASSAKSAAVSLAKTRFRLDRLRVSSVEMDSEPSKTMTNLARSLGHERPEGHDWTDIVVKVVDAAGNVFEVGRVTCKYDGMLGESHAVADLVCRKSWGSEDDDDSVSCPLCYERGHGAGACPRG